MRLFLFAGVVVVLIAAFVAVPMYVPGFPSPEIINTSVVQTVSGTGWNAYYSFTTIIKNTGTNGNIVVTSRIVDDKGNPISTQTKTVFILGGHQLTLSDSFSSPATPNCSVEVTARSR